MVTLSDGGDTICRPGPSNDETMGKQNYKKALKFDVFLSVFLHYFMYSKVMSVHFMVKTDDPEDHVERFAML